MELVPSGVLVAFLLRRDRRVSWGFAAEHISACSVMLSELTSAGEGCLGDVPYC